MRITCFITICLLCAPVTTRAQADGNVAGPEVPRLELRFSSVGENWSLPSDVFVGRPICDANGGITIRFADKPVYERDHIVTVSPTKQPVSFPYENIAGLVSPHVKDIDTVDGDVFLFLGARQSDQPGALSRLSPTQADSAQISRASDYIARFKADGTYDSTIKLDLPFRPIRAAAFSADRFLVMGAGSNGSPVLALVNGSGTLVRYFDAPIASAEELSDRVKRVSPNVFSDSPSSFQLASALSGYRFVHVGGKLLLFMPQLATSVIEITPGGATRTVNVHLPPELKLDSILPADREAWLVRVAVGTEVMPYFLQIDPSDGSVTKELRTGDVPTTTIMCVAEKQFVGLRWQQDKTYLIEAKMQ